MKRASSSAYWSVSILAGAEEVKGWHLRVGARVKAFVFRQTDPKNALPRECGRTVYRARRGRKSERVGRLLL